MNKIKLIVSVIVFIFFPLMNVFAQEFIDGPPLRLAINNIVFNKEIHKIDLDLGITNNTQKFIDGLDSYLEIYKGNSLKNEGYMFSGLDLVYISSQPLKKLFPGEKEREHLSYDIPSTLPSGNYFVRYVVKDRENMNFGITYSKTPLKISGTGDYIGFLNAFVEVAGKKSNLMLGLRANKNDVFSIIIPLDENEKLKKKIASNDLYIETEIHPIANNDKDFKKLPRKKITISQYGGRDVVKIDVKPWEGMSTGSFDVIVRIFNSDNVQISSDTKARWFRSEEVSRLKEIRTETNYYNKGDKLDVGVRAAFFGYAEDRNFLVKVKLVSNKGDMLFDKITTLKKGETELKFDFSNFVVNKPVVVKSIEATLTDQKTGNVSDKLNIELSGDKLFVRGKELNTQNSTVPKGRKITMGYSWMYWLVFIVIIVGVSVLIFILKNKRRMMPLFVGVIFGGGMLLGFHFVKADCSINASSCADENSTGLIYPIKTWTDPAPEGDQGECPIAKKIEIYSSYSCTNCLNGSNINMGLEARYSNGADDLNECFYKLDGAVPHHETSGSYGPYAVDINLTSGGVDYRSLVRIGTGCACAEASAFSEWKNFSCTTPKRCTGSLPAGAKQCSDTNTGLTADTPWERVDNCSNVGSAKCKYEFQCSDGDPNRQPPNGAQWCPGDSHGLTVRTNWHEVSTCTTADKCEYYFAPECGPANRHSFSTETQVTQAGLCEANNTASSIDSSQLEVGGPWTWTCSRSGHTINCEAYQIGQCSSNTGGDVTMSNACTVGKINSINFNGGTLNWSCGTIDADPPVAQSLLYNKQPIQGYNFDINAMISDSVAKHTDNLKCACSPRYVYTCPVTTQADCSNHCDSSVEEVHTPFKRDVHCFMGKSTGYFTTKQDYASHPSQHASGEPTTCTNKSVTCPPCGASGGGSDTINETN